MRAGCFALIVFMMSCFCKCPVALPHGTLGLSAVYDCGIPDRTHFLHKNFRFTCFFCKFGIFVNSVKRHIWDIQNLQHGHALHISASNKVISPYRESFIFTKLRSFAKINP